MQENKGASNALEIQLPVRVVELRHLNMRDGSPVRVQCERIPELTIADIFKSLPGERPKGMATSEEADPIEQLRALGTVGPPLIEAGTVLAGPDGEVRPAFYFGDKAPNAHSIPGRLLREEDKVLLIETIMTLGGYVGGAAGTAFHDGDGSGRDGGVGTGQGGEEVRADAAPGAD